MITLHVNPAQASHQQIIDRVKDMSLAHRIELSTDQQLQLVHSDECYTGQAAINQYLDTLEGFVAQWYECRCDKYFGEYA